MTRRITALIVACISVVCLASPLFAAEVSLSVAASLKDAMNELTDGYLKKHPAVTFRKNYGASGALAKQIENGAPADIFVSANLKWVDYMKEKKIIDAPSINVFAHNSLVVAGNPKLKITSMQDLLKLNRIAIGSPKSVPAGEYATEAFKSAGIDGQLGSKLIMAKDVRETLLYAERGEVDAALVYKTDALISKQVSILYAVPQNLYKRVTYPMGLTVSGSKNADTAAFYKYLKSAEADKVLEKYGFATK